MQNQSLRTSFQRLSKESTSIVDFLRMNEVELNNAHRHSYHNRKEIEQSFLCGCFSCNRTFPSSEVEDYIDEGETALCPYCGVDTVIGEASGIQLSKEFLHNMHERWI